MPENIEMEVKTVDTPEIELEMETGDSISAATAEAYAVGKRNGMDVGENDPAYNNNAKYYAGKAKESAESAKEDADAISETKKDIDKAAEAAKSSAAGAANSAAAAAESAGSADAAAKAADSSAGEASTSKKSAADSAQAAKGSADAAAQRLEDVNQAAAEALESIPDDYTTMQRYQTLLAEVVPGTVQSFEFSGGNVSLVKHVNGSVIVRQDAFTYGTGTITEVRTLSSGEKLTIITNLTTLETTAAYEAA